MILQRLRAGPEPTPVGPFARSSSGRGALACQHRLQLWLAVSLLLFFFVLAGCSERNEQPYGSGTSVRDSSDVLIVENSAPAQAGSDLWALSPTPTVEIGATDEDDPARLFSQIRSMDRQSDGSIVVVDGQSNEIRRFDSSGRHLSTSGGSGTGPGEFLMANLIIGLPADTIVVHDQLQARISVFRPDGSHERTTQLSALPGFSPAMTPLGLSSDDRIVIRGMPAPPPAAFGPGVVQATAHLADVETGRMDPLAHVPFAIGATDRQGQSLPVLPLVVPAQAVAADGLWVSRPPGPELRKIGWDGSVDRIVRFSDAGLPLTAEQRDRIVAWQRDRLSAAPVDAPDPAVLSSLPAFSRMISDREGHIWIQEGADDPDPANWEFGAPRGSPVWRVLSPQGQWLGSIRMPEEFQPHAIGANWVLGVRTDDLGVEFVQLYELSRS